jgi:D-alanyl-D-alanine dipeptidase
MLVDLKASELPLTFDIAYATTENFTGAPVYARADCYLHERAVSCLELAIELAAGLGLQFVIFDAFRPGEAQWKLWDHTPDPEFLADPRRGSPHSRGVAIDLSLADENGKLLDMGTGFDAFTPKSHHGVLTIAGEAQRNRAILLGVMIAAGWRHYEFEWWHYQLADAHEFPLLSDHDLPRSMMSTEPAGSE